MYKYKYIYKLHLILYFSWVSACYGRPSAIDEATCDVDLLPIPSDPEPDDETRLHIAWILHINLLRIFAQVRE
jgi:hypothetical protein